MNKSILKIAGLAASALFLSLTLTSCEENEPGDNNTGAEPNTIQFMNNSLPVSWTNVSFGSNLGGKYKLFMDLHDGPIANNIYQGSYFLSFGPVTSDSLRVSPGVYNFTTSGTNELNTFNFVELRTILSGDTSYYSCTGGTLEVFDANSGGNYDMEFSLNMVDNQNASVTGTLSGNYTGGTQYFSVKGIEQD